jgi:phage terminase small subunit
MNQKQARFVDEYIIDLNATQAAIRSGYSAKTAAQIGERLLRNVDIKAFLTKRLEDRKARTEITQDTVLQEIARIALFDPRKLFKEDGSPKPINELDDDTAAAIAGVDVVEGFEGSGTDRVFVGYTKKYKIADKNAALEKLARHLDLYAPSKHEIDHNINWPVPRPKVEG